MAGKFRRRKGWETRFAQAYNLVVNPEMAAVILEGLERNQDLYGAYFCPCKLERTPQNVCPCKELTLEGHCHCGLFKPKEG